MAVASATVNRRSSNELRSTTSALYLANRAGILIDAWFGSKDFGEQLAQLGVSVGADLSEHAVGTNGSGTALATDQPVMVMGPEHYVDRFRAAVCYGAPIRVDHQTIGALTLVSPFEETNPLLLSLVVRMADEISNSIEDQSEIIGVDHDAPPRSPIVDLPPTGSFDQLMGLSPRWRTAVSQARRAAMRSDPVLVTGEPGSGRLSLLQAISSLVNEEQFMVLDCASIPGVGLPAWLEALRSARSAPLSTVVIRHIDLLDARSTAAIVDLITTDRPAATSRLAATCNPIDRAVRRSIGPLLERVGNIEIGVPSLRERATDISTIALGVIERESLDITITPQALDAMAKAEWPGNIRQLKSTLRALGFEAGGRAIGVDDLPADLHPVHGDSRLTALERLERDAILASLRRHHHNKTEAAANLGIARSTLYRKMRAYQIDDGDGIAATGPTKPTPSPGLRPTSWS